MLRTVTNSESRTLGYGVAGSLALHGGYGLLNTIAGHRYVAALPIDNSGVQMTWEVTVEREGADKPVCIAESLVRRYP